MSLSSTTSRPTALAVWMRLLVIAILVALAVPAIAAANEGDPGVATAEEQAATTAPAAEQPAPVTGEPAPPATEEPASPVAEEPATAEPTAPPAQETPVPAEEPVAAEPQAPPAAADPTPTAPPAPSRGGGTAVDIPLPVFDLPEIEIPPLPSIPEVLPGDPAIPGAGVAPVPGIGELAPVLLAPVAPAPPSLGPPPTLPRVATPAAPAAEATAPVTVAAQGPDPLTVATLGGPPILQGADPISEASREAVEGTAVLAAAAVPLQGAFVTLDPARPAALPAAGAPATPATEAFAAAEAEFPAPQVVSPTGPAPSQSLLAVLAAYILPGSGPVPASTIMVLVMLGLILAAVFAPRPAGAERIWLSGLVGARVGHGLAVRRPG